MINKEQSFELMSLIQQFYENFEITQSKIDSWHLILKDYDFQTLRINLLEYCKINKFPPRIADLLNERPVVLDRINAIPDAAETRMYLDGLEADRELTEEQIMAIENEKKKIRQILGIGGAE